MDNDRITRREAARMTGYSPDGLSNLHKMGRGPARIPNTGHRVYYSRAEVIRWKRSDEYQILGKYGK